MCEPENIKAVESLGVDMIGLVFRKDDERYVRMVSSKAGIIPDYAPKSIGDNSEKNDNSKKAGRVGVFADDMPQNIVTRIYNYSLDYVQLEGEETVFMIDNLRRTVDPDIHLGLKIIKKINVLNAEDLRQSHDYEGHVDMLLFAIRKSVANLQGGTVGAANHYISNLVNAYDGDTPFLVGGDISLEDVNDIKEISNPMFAGVDLDCSFEIKPGSKDVEKLRSFISLL